MGHEVADVGLEAGPDGELVPIADAERQGQAEAGADSQARREASRPANAGDEDKVDGHGASQGAQAGNGEQEQGRDGDGTTDGSNEPDELDPEGMNGRSGMKNKDYDLWRACENGQTDLVRERLQQHADPNAPHPGVFKWTAMHLAAINDQAPTLELLHEHGARLDLRDGSGRTPIRLARKHLKLEAVRALEAMMGYERGEGSDTDVELGEELPWDIKEQLGLDPDAPAAGQLPTDPQDSFFQDLEAKLASNSSALGWSAFKTSMENSTEHQERERQREANREASRKRREAACEYPDAEKVDADGFTASQRMHLNRLIYASKVNAETGAPIESVLANQGHEVPQYDLPPRRRPSQEGPDHAASAQAGGPDGQEPALRMPWETAN